MYKYDGKKEEEREGDEEEEEEAIREKKTRVCVIRRWEEDECKEKENTIKENGCKKLKGKRKRGRKTRKKKKKKRSGKSKVRVVVLRTNLKSNIYDSVQKKEWTRKVDQKRKGKIVRLG